MLSELDLEHCIPPRRLVSSLRLLLILYEQIGHHLGSALISYTIRVVFLISANVHGLWPLVINQVAYISATQIY